VGIYDWYCLGTSGGTVRTFGIVELSWYDGVYGVTVGSVGLLYCLGTSGRTVEAFGIVETIWLVSLSLLGQWDFRWYCLGTSGGGSVGTFGTGETMGLMVSLLSPLDFGTFGVFRWDCWDKGAIGTVGFPLVLLKDFWRLGHNRSILGSGWGHNTKK